MAGKAQAQKLNRRIFKSYLTTTISISMVLFLIGLLGVVLLNAERLAKYVRENIGVTLVLKDDIQETEIAESDRFRKVGGIHRQGNSCRET
jgi:cell division transport system permease protein